MDQQHILLSDFRADFIYISSLLYHPAFAGMLAGTLGIHMTVCIIHMQDDKILRLRSSECRKSGYSQQ